MLLSTTSAVPDAEVTQIIGVVHGSSVHTAKGGLKDAGPTGTLKEEALEQLKEEATQLIADAVVDITIGFCSDQSGVMCYAAGTAVKLDRLPAWYLRQLQHKTPSDGDIFDAESDARADEESPAVSIEAVTDEKELAVLDFMEKLAIDRHRCESLYEAGYTDLEKLKKAEVADLKSVRGINPTIARMIRSKLDDA